MRRLWVYKCNAKNQPHQVSWGDWDDFFVQAKTGPTEWGSTRWIWNSASRRFIFDEMRIRDLVLAWQTDRRQAVGLCEVADLQDWVDDDGSVHRDLILKRIKVFSPGVRLLDLKQSDQNLARVRAFRPGQIATIYATSQPEARVLLRVCGIDKSTLARERKKASGSGYGDPDSNKRVERAAIARVTSELVDAGWSVKSVETEGRHFDLLATKGSRERHVEVKGAQGPDRVFFLTAAEKRQAEIDSVFELWLVTSALTHNAAVQRWKGQEVLAFEFSPISFRVRAD